MELRTHTKKSWRIGSALTRRTRGRGKKKSTSSRRGIGENLAEIFFNLGSGG